MSVELVRVGFQRVLRLFHGIFYAPGGQIKFGDILNQEIRFGIFLHREPEILYGFIQVIAAVAIGGGHLRIKMPERVVIIGRRLWRTRLFGYRRQGRAIYFWPHAPAEAPPRARRLEYSWLSAI